MSNKGLPNLVSVLESRQGLALLICLHIAVCSISLIDVALSGPTSLFEPKAFHILYTPAGLPGALAIVAGFAVLALIFLYARCTLGYFLGFYSYTMVLGYLWINHFSEAGYDHRLAGISAAASAVAFLLPALLITAPIRQVFTLSPRRLEHVCTFLLVVAAATIIAGSFYNFRIVAVKNIYDYREALAFPTIVAYLIPLTSSLLLPFAFACFVARRHYWRAGLALVLAVLLYPVTLSKLALFTPAWLVFIALLARIFGARTATVLSLFLPISVGVLSAMIKTQSSYFDIVNFRMLAIPSAAMEFYNDFFSNHPLTHFCQIWLLKPLMSCPYREPLSIVMEQAYGLGRYNASPFATEGIASVGPALAPIPVFFYGLVIGFANRLSAGLPASFVLTSGAVLPQVLLNVPLSTTMLTHGAALLFLLWYITPRSIFEQNQNEAASPAV